MLNFIAIDLQLYKIIQITRVSFLGHMGHFTVWICLSLRPKRWSQSDVECNQSQPRVIADVIAIHR